MAIRLSSGFFSVAGLPAAQLVQVRVYIKNLETKAATATVQVSKLVGNEKQTVVLQKLEIPGDQTETVTVESDVIEGESAEVTVELSEGGFTPPDSPLRPGVAVVSIFTGDQSTSLLQWIAANDFVPVPVY